MVGDIPSLKVVFCGGILPLKQKCRLNSFATGTGKELEAENHTVHIKSKIIKVGQLRFQPGMGFHGVSKLRNSLLPGGCNNRAYTPQVFHAICLSEMKPWPKSKLANVNRL